MANFLGIARGWIGGPSVVTHRIVFENNRGSANSAAGGIYQYHICRGQWRLGSGYIEKRNAFDKTNGLRLVSVVDKGINNDFLLFLFNVNLNNIFAGGKISPEKKNRNEIKKAFHVG